MTLLKRIIKSLVLGSSAALVCSVGLFGCAQDIESPVALKTVESHSGVVHDISGQELLVADASGLSEESQIEQLLLTGRADECCTEPGQSDECWEFDAEMDGVSCYQDSDCGSGVCNMEKELCECTSNDDCADGICTDEGICGPSWCNGYRVCSCWGGCEWWNSNGSLTPSQVAQDSQMYCCEGDWPTGSAGSPLSGGYFSETPCEMGECAVDADCDDGNVCTNDTCNGDGECVFDFNTNPCADDGVFCNGAEVCDGAGVCGHTGDPCLSGDACNNECNEDLDSCHVPSGGICDDLDPCTQTDTCDGSGNCEGGNPVDCSDNNVCTNDSCTDDGLGNAVCNYTDNDGAVCDADDNACTVNDTCSAGVCNPGSLYDCSALTTSCSNGLCEEDPSGNASCIAVDLPAGTSCDDGLYCNGVDSCNGDGVCISSGDPCLAGGQCDDNCNEAADNCYEVQGTSCDADNNACTPNDSCNGAGICVADIANAVVCDGMEDQCNNSECNSATGLCEYQNSLLMDAQCNIDDSGCTTETCQGSNDNQRLTCTAVSTVDCDDGNECTDNFCTSTGAFAYTCDNPGLPDTTACNFDNDGCTQDDHCNGAGACVAGTAIVSMDCVIELGLDTDCNTGVCTSTGENTYACSAAVIGTSTPGECNADNNGCTLDTCVDSGNPLVGATCEAGGAADCSALENLPCTSGVCNAVDNYDFDCIESYASTNVSCNFDSNGCTEDDYCDGAGSCVAGTPATCVPLDACHTASCESIGDNSHNCIDVAVENCCLVDADCADLSCPGAAPPVGCSQAVCQSNTCVCQNELAGTACSDYVESDYPPNCYDGFCDDAGGCVPTQHPAENNLCSDAFVAGDPSQIDTTKDSYLGAISNDQAPGTAGAIISVTGSTTCAKDNYSAAGTLCVEEDGSTPIGDGGRDLVYAFRYQTNKPDDFNLYSYVIKVEATYDVGVYIKTNVENAADCPEGNNPALDDPDSGGFQGDVISNKCLLPFNDGVSPDPLPNVLEDECSTEGNILYGQECCDPCVDGEFCGYKWCQRGIPDGCDMCGGGCTDTWEYPPDPIDCSSEVPGGYTGYNYMASTIISPQGATDESWRTVFIFMDGVAGETGDFFVTVEKQEWFAGPCDRVNDDMRVYNITHPGEGGSTFQGSLEDVANSHHASGGSCGGYGCTSGWSGDSSCHGTGSANQFWPNMESFMIHRSAAEGNGTYCLMTDESVTDAADLVMQLKYRTSSGATVCDQAYGDVFRGDPCWNDNHAGGSIKKEFTAAAGELYLVWISQKAWSDRPCDPASGDNCNYAFTVIEGSCPVVCTDPNKTVAGANIDMDDTVLKTVVRNGYIDASTGDSYYLNANDRQDHVYALNNNTGETVDVTIEACGTGDAMVGLFDCSQSLLQYKDQNGSGSCDSFVYSLPPSDDPYYIVVDTYGSTPLYDYSLNVTWGTAVAACVPWSNWYSSSSLAGTVTIDGSGFSQNPIVGNTDGEHKGFKAGGTNDFKSTDQVWEVVVTQDATVRMSACDDSGYGSYDGMLALVDCEGTILYTNDDGCGSGGMSKFTANLEAGMSPYYLVVDGYNNAKGAYGIGLSYQ